MNLSELTIFDPEFFHTVERVMIVLAVVVFVALQYFKAGYGYLRAKGWGPMIDNKLGWVLMEIPVLIAALLIIIPARGWQHLTEFCWCTTSSARSSTPS